MAAKVSIFRIKYEIVGSRDRTSWLTTLAAYSADDATSFLSKISGGRQINVSEIGTVTKLDALTDAVAEAVASEVRPAKVVKKPEPKFVCTFCGRDDFKNETGLKGHMTRWCEEAEKLRAENVTTEPDKEE
jgi:hypothetical protein